MKSDASIRQTNKTFDGCFQVCASIQLDPKPCHRLLQRSQQIRWARHSHGGRRAPCRVEGQAVAMQKIPGAQQLILTHCVITAVDPDKMTR